MVVRRRYAPGVKFYCTVPIGEANPIISTNTDRYYYSSIKVQVFDQDDPLRRDAAQYSVPRWEHTFTAASDVVYKPGNSKRYQAVVEAYTVHLYRTAINTWASAPTAHQRETVEYLHDDGQSVTVQRRSTKYMGISLSSALSESSSVFAGSGVLYRVNGKGNLVRYVHDASGEFVDYSGQEIGWGWGGLRRIMAVRDHGLYTVDSGGALRYYHHNSAGSWDDSNGRVIGSGWAHPWVGAGRFGQLYAINSGGDLLYYEHDGAFAWTRTAKKIGGGWSAQGVFTGGTNCLYLVNAAGELRYYYHDDSLGWVKQNLGIGTGWGGLSPLGSSGNGEIYAVTSDGNLLFYRHDTSKRFLSGSGRTIGWGWGSASTHGLLPSAR